ncbi:hypothetical protein CEE36_02830 [candidate division TA06 bacterium B3_TA06]|uniref:Uncharacterized protein n=1 Tax=candidate division TA06 bacterium B3_TA06 TaxID=2012487 RepID=A0A532V8U1_UNCT6|nr:MAG: hypothetical protein CEE36_02830 [candidate division TA06 bacterium B3_TA06]
MPKKADKELEKFKKVVGLLRQLYKDDGMKILVHPDGVDLKIEEGALEKYIKGMDLKLEEVKSSIGEISKFLNVTRGKYEEIEISVDILLGPPSEEETEKARKERGEILEKKIGILKEIEPEWAIRRRSKAKRRAKTPVVTEVRWEINRRLADERKSKRESTPFATIEFRYLEPPFGPSEDPLARILSPIFGIHRIQKSLSLGCDKEDIRYLISELKKIEDELATGESK